MKIPLSYRLGNSLYNLAFSIARFLSSKASIRREGLRSSKLDLIRFDKQYLDQKRLWFHASSVGEYEQCLPVLLEAKNRWPDHKVILSVYSPSLYDYLSVATRADPLDLYIYLPQDTAINALEITNLIKPEMVIWSKYDFWFYHMKAIHDQAIPLYLVSAIFRKKQVFFRPAFKSWSSMLHCFNHIFLQDQASAILLEEQKITSYSIAGDTRLDRVMQRKQESLALAKIESFKAGREMLILASVHPSDLQVVRQVLKEKAFKKILIVPHDPKTSFLSTLSKLSNGEKYSETTSDLQDLEVLIVDTVGLLFDMYKYADTVYVGGGFGEGIHNILEPLAFKKSIYIGPNYHKFKEAVELVELGLVKEISKNFDGKMTHHADNKSLDQYIKTHSGATDKIIKHIF